MDKRENQVQISNTHLKPGCSNMCLCNLSTGGPVEKGRSQDLANYLVQQKIKHQGPVSDNREQEKEGSEPWLLVFKKDGQMKTEKNIRLYL